MNEIEICEVVSNGDLAAKLSYANVREFYTVEDMSVMYNVSRKLIKDIVGGVRENPKRRFE